MSEVLVREYEEKDRPAILKCVFELQSDEHERFPHQWVEATEALASTYLDYTLDSVKKEGEDAKIFVGEIDGVVVGWIVVSIGTDDGPDVALKRYGYISEVAVLREYQGRGVGKALMAKAEEFIKSKGLEWIKLSVSRGNRASDFYLKSGYKERSVRMEKKLI
jgi:ribosomal protein S18 acetylase RimI-like enzyme